MLAHRLREETVVLLQKGRGSKLLFAPGGLNDRHPGRRYIQGSSTDSFSFKFNAPQVSRSLPPPPPPLPNTKPQWSFKFIQNQKESAPKTAERKWNNYSLPNKDTILKQEKQALQTRKEQKEREEVLSKAISQRDTRAQENPPSARKTKRTLKPRKALISLSPKAVSHLKNLLDQPEPKLIRVGTRNRGCSGLTYDLQYISEPGKFDEVVEQDGVKVVIDSKALFSVVGSEMDWIDDKISSRFIFRNPNSKGTCGCGESFMV